MAATELSFDGSVVFPADNVGLLYGLHGALG